MVRIIETNLSIDDNNIVKDHQSRIIETKSWNVYVHYYKHNIEPGRVHSNFKSLTNMSGDSLPQYGYITEFKYDNFHLSCCHINPYGFKTMKLAYLCG